MAWIYLAELEESATHSKNGLNPSLTVKSIPTVKGSCFLEWETFQSRMPPSGMILLRLDPNTSTTTLISSTEDFLARISVLQEMEKAWRESEADYFLRSYAWPKKSSPNSYSLKTCQRLQHEADFKLLERLPRWGMIVDGVLYPLQALEHYTNVKDGFYWPTPTARDATRSKGGSPSDLRRNTPNLATQVLKVIATPTASQANKPIRCPSPSRQNSSHGEDIQDSIGRLNPESIGKKLCPRWVSVLMGYPITWTDCAPWVIPLFQRKQKKHSKC